MTAKERITADQLRELMHYDPATGFLTWASPVGRGASVRGIGDRAGSVNSVHGYEVVGIGGTRYRTHMLAWLYMTGQWPHMLVDHRNLDRADNRWANLRLATHSQNHANAPRRQDNKSGLKGVYRRADGQAWVAQIKSHTGKRYLGSFDCIAAAHLRYLLAAAVDFGEFARAA